jgi:hypothetical protein
VRMGPSPEAPGLELRNVYGVTEVTVYQAPCPPEGALPRGAAWKLRPHTPPCGPDKLRHPRIAEPLLIGIRCPDSRTVCPAGAHFPAARGSSLLRDK